MVTKACGKYLRGLRASGKPITEEHLRQWDVYWFHEWEYFAEHAIDYDDENLFRIALRYYRPARGMIHRRVPRRILQAGKLEWFDIWLSLPGVLVIDNPTYMNMAIEYFDVTVVEELRARGAMPDDSTINQCRTLCALRYCHETMGLRLTQYCFEAAINDGDDDRVLYLRERLEPWHLDLQGSWSMTKLGVQTYFESWDGSPPDDHVSTLTNVTHETLVPVLEGIFNHATPDWKGCHALNSYVALLHEVFLHKALQPPETAVENARTLVKYHDIAWKRGVPTTIFHDSLHVRALSLGDRTLTAEVMARHPGTRDVWEIFHTMHEGTQTELERGARVLLEHLDVGEDSAKQLQTLRRCAQRMRDPTFLVLLAWLADTAVLDQFRPPSYVVMDMEPIERVRLCRVLWPGERQGQLIEARCLPHPAAQTVFEFAGMPRTRTTPPWMRMRRRVGSGSV